MHSTQTFRFHLLVRGVCRAGCTLYSACVRVRTSKNGPDLFAVTVPVAVYCSSTVAASHDPVDG
jgi:hypothetical protein